MSSDKYKRTVDLLLEILPFALQDGRVALKGGTAINLFHRNMPRLSVDIDLCYLLLEDRETTYKNLHQILLGTKESIEKKLGLNVSASTLLNSKTHEAKLVVSLDDLKVKIEPNFIIRGTVFTSEEISLAKNSAKEFGKSIDARCLSFADTYGGKICAALDRQHPRDLFDIKFLFENEGITKEIKDAFIFYLISHKRPINELLRPNLKDIQREFNEEFLSMANVQVEIGELQKVREKLINDIRSALSEQDKKFLISFVANAPDWSLISDDKIKDYPSVKWKLLNQQKLNRAKRDLYIDSLKVIFEGTKDKI